MRNAADLNPAAAGRRCRASIAHCGNHVVGRHGRLARQWVKPMYAMKFRCVVIRKSSRGWGCGRAHMMRIWNYAILLFAEIEAASEKSAQFSRTI